MSVFGTRFAAFFLPSGRIFAAFRRGLPGEQASFTASAGQQTCPFGAVAAGLGGGSLLAGAAHGLLLVAEVEEKADGEQGDGRACDVGRHLDEGQPVHVVVEEVLVHQHTHAAQVAEGVGHADEEAEVAAVAEQGYPALVEHGVEAGIAQVQPKAGGNLFWRTSVF